MSWLLALAMRYRRNGWFTRGAWNPVPGRWPGWAVLGGWGVAVAATGVIPQGDRAPVLVALGLVLIVVAYWTCDDG